MKNNIIEKFPFKEVERNQDGDVITCHPKSRADFLVGYSCRKCIFKNCCKVNEFRHTLK